MRYGDALKKKQELDAIVGDSQKVPVERCRQRLINLTSLLVENYYLDKINSSTEEEKQLWINAKEQFIQKMVTIYKGYIKKAPDQKNFWDEQIKIMLPQQRKIQVTIAFLRG